MCRPLRDGGRRCPIHLHSSISTIKVAAKASGLTRYQTERLFSELTREGRRAEILTPEQQETNIASVKTAAAELGILEPVEKEIEKATEYDRELDGPTGYAQRTIIARAKARAKNLHEVFERVAKRTGLTVEEVQHKYETVRDNVVRERGGEYPEEYTSATRANAVRLNVPYDVSSVVALERIQTLTSEQLTRPRVTRIPNPHTGIIESFGYDDGRLEVVISDNPKVYAYQNVPEDLWHEFSTSNDPTSVLLRKIAGKSEYQYESAEDAERDSKLYNCASCGQFANQYHSCPVRVVREEIAKHVPAEQVEKVLLETPGIAEQVTVDDEEELPESSVEEEIAEEVEEESVVQENQVNVVLPLADLVEPVDVSLLVATPEMFPSTKLVDVDFGSEEAKEIVYKAPTTLDEQLRPSMVKPVKVWQEEGTGGFRVSYIDTMTSSLYRLPDDLREKALFAKENNVGFIYEVKHEAGGEQYNLIVSYDTNFYQSDTQRVWGNSTPSLFRVFKTSPTQESHSEISANDYAAKEDAFFEKLAFRDDVVNIDPVATVTRRDGADAVGDKKFAPKVSLGDIRQIKKAFKENKAVILPVTFVMPRRSDGYDDQGHVYSSNGGTTVTGHVVARKGQHGEIEILSSHRSLKCNCYSYRNKYYCSHVSYSYRHIGNVVAQATLATNSRVVNGDPNSLENVRIRLLGSLISRSDIDVVKREDDSHYITFGSEITTGRRTSTYGYPSDIREQVVVPEDCRQINAALSFEQSSKIIEIEKLARQINSIYLPPRLAQVRQALKKADVEVPVKISFSSNRWTRLPGTPETESGNVTGAIVYEKTNDSDKAVVKSNTLKCDCGEYKKKYDCEHVRFALGQPSVVLNLKRRDTQPYNINDMMNIHRVSLRHTQDVLNRMSRDGLSREAAEEAALEAARLVREAAERREAERAEQARIAALAAAERRREEMIKREELNKETIEVTKKYVDDMMNRWQNVEESYASNPDKFYEDVQAALKRKAAGEPVIAFRTENVTDGMATPIDGARRFGVELEFDLPKNMSDMDRRKALKNIGNDLYEAGLTETAYQTGYHDGQNTGWSRWSFESDCTVSGEVVSPILSDSSEDWKQLQTVCGILRKHGAIATTKTGSHVHVSTASYGSSTAKNAQLLRDTNADEDVLYRLASNPATGKHRGTQWCGPNIDDGMGDIPDTLLDGHRVLSPVAYDNHNIAVNFGSASNQEYKKQHVEFRHWDGTLDESIVQAQVLMSLALVDRAERTVVQEGGTKKEPQNRKQLGKNKEQEKALRNGNARRKLTKEEYQQINLDAMTFIDSIARRREDKEQLAALVAITNWQDNS